jgi:hypothetical protein
MLSGIIHCEFNKVYKYLIFVFFLGEAVSLFNTDIIFLLPYQ